MSINVNNFTYPSFHSSDLLNNLSACGEKILTGPRTISGLYVIGAPLGAIALSYLAYKILEEMAWKSDNLKHIELSELPSLLQRAEVSGNTISFNGRLGDTYYYCNKVTFREVSNKIERLYANSVRSMREKQELYEEFLRPTMAFAKIALFIICPFFAVLDRPPALNHYEEAQVRSALLQRKRAYDQLNILFDTEGSFFSKVADLYNNTIGRVNSKFKISVERDKDLLEEMVSRRKVSQSSTRQLELAITAYANGKTSEGRLLFAAATIGSVFNLVHHVALMAIYSCFVFSKTWGDTVALVAKDTADDLNYLSTAALGVFSPESIPGTKVEEPILINY